MQITQDAKFRHWVKPGQWLYDQMRAYDAKKKLGLPSETICIKRGWYVVDMTIAPDYTDGTQVYVDDKLSPLISKLRQDGAVGKKDKTPMGSRFAILPNEWAEQVLSKLSAEFKSDGIAFPGLETAALFNAIGNIYDNNRGKFNCWEWFEDLFRGGRRLCGGDRGDGGLAGVDYSSAGSRGGGIAGRPLGCFV
jgi:hypothetical protein